MKKEEAPKKEENSEKESVVEKKEENQTPAKEVEMEVLSQKEDASTFNNLLQAMDHMSEETATVEVGENTNAQNIVDSLLGQYSHKE